MSAGADTEFSLLAIIVSPLFGLLILVTLIVLAAVIGKRANRIRGWLWAAPGLYFASGAVPFLLSLISSFGGPTDGSMPSDDQLAQMAQTVSIGDFIGQLCQAGVIVCYCLAALRIAHGTPAAVAPPSDR